jgi:hypothetical protein
MRVGSEDRDIAVLYIQTTYTLKTKQNKTKQNPLEMIYNSFQLLRPIERHIPSETKGQCHKCQQLPNSTSRSFKPFNNIT